MATMTASAREAMILGYGENSYRLPTVREAACMMSFPIDYWFYGESKGIKHTLVGNAVPPKMSYALAKAIAKAEQISMPNHYPQIKHDKDIRFVDLNGRKFAIRAEKPRRDVAKFKYHIPYLIIDAYRVELTNYHSDFTQKIFKWDAEIHYSQGKEKAKKYTPALKIKEIPEKYHESLRDYLLRIKPTITDMDSFQKVYCMTSEQRKPTPWEGPYELLDSIREYIDMLLTPKEQTEVVVIGEEPFSLPLAIVIGYYILTAIVDFMGGSK